MVDMRKISFKIDEIMLVLIVAVIAIAVSVYDRLNEPAGMEAEKITDMILDDHSISFANNGIIDEKKLAEVQNIDYNDFKKSLKAKNDFCIYIEDENGNVLLAKGSPKLSGDGLYCRE